MYIFSANTNNIQKTYRGYTEDDKYQYSNFPRGDDSDILKGWVELKYQGKISDEPEPLFRLCQIG